MERIRGLLDGAERDCRLALPQGALPSSKGAIFSSVVLKTQGNPFLAVGEKRHITTFTLFEVGT